MKTERVRPVALCVIRRDNELFVAEGYDPAKQEDFYRPLGGAIQFGERAEQTLMREIHEEIGADIADLRYLGTLQNLFTYNGQKGHEIVLVFEGEFADKAFYKKSFVAGLDHDNLSFKAVWHALDDFGPAAPLYPEGLKDLLDKKTDPGAARRSPARGTARLPGA